ncbi:MAG: DUF2069 domain-containing protein, partial [Rhodocyclaceae bacterium]
MARTTTCRWLLARLAGKPPSLPLVVILHDRRKTCQWSTLPIPSLYLLEGLTRLLTDAGPSRW